MQRFITRYGTKLVPLALTGEPIALTAVAVIGIAIAGTYVYEKVKNTAK